MSDFNRKKSAAGANVPLGFIINSILFTLAFAAVGIGFVHVKNQQHVLGERTREAELAMREIRAFNQVLRAEIDHLTSHARIRAEVGEGNLALIPISDQYVARLTPPVIVAGGGAELRAAMAVAGGEMRQ